MEKKYIFIISLITVFFNISIYCQSPRIVSLAPSYTKQIYSLEAQNKIVGYTKYGQKLDSNSTINVVGSVVNVNIEKIRKRECNMNSKKE